MRKRTWLVLLSGLPLLVSGLLPVPSAMAANPVQVILDGRSLSLAPAATIVDDRTLVPMRGLLEAMGATLTWDNDTRTVTATREGRYVRLRIDRRLVCLNDSCTSGATLDVPARLIDDRTFVPARAVSQALGARVSWDNERRAVVIETNKAPDYSFTSITIPTLKPLQEIQGSVELKVAGAPAGTQVHFMLIDPATGAGPLVAAGRDVNGTYTFTPDPTVKGARLMVAGVKDEAGTWRYSDPVTVFLAPKPRVTVTGIEPGGTVTGPITLGASANFVSTTWKLQLLDAIGNAQDLGTAAGPFDQITWYPQIGHNGQQWLKVTAYDPYGNAYPSEPVKVNVQSGYRQSLAGVTDGAVLKGPVKLSTSANYGIEAVKYVLDGKVLGWGYNYNWNFDEALNGQHTLQVEILGKDGQLRYIGPYKFTVNIQPYVTLGGVGPDEVVTGKVTLSASSNKSIGTPEYYVTDPSGTTVRIGEGASLAWTPTRSGNHTLWVKATDSAGRTLTSEKVSFRVYTGTIYKARPVAEKMEFLAMAKQLSVPAYKETGIAASLQVAQALLETGWGQSVPVDKYTGQFSYNLFGIKGTGTAGKVVHNTWEVYGGRNYYVDAEFRAYNNVQESWMDHKAILLERPWYAPFRAVMTNPVLGAHGLRKSGYATDPNYPSKLIRIIEDNKLWELDLLEL
jgi:hypothetical protein